MKDSNGIRLVQASNASPYTAQGTNTYILGYERVAIIDPGPHDISHIEAILGAVGKADVEAILLTHGHWDHCGATHELKRECNAPIYQFTRVPEGVLTPLGNRTVSPRLGEGSLFVCDDVQSLSDGQILGNNEWSLKVVHTPGHCPDHVCFYDSLNNFLFSGDHIMGFASSVIIPPHGRLEDYFLSLQKIEDLNCERILSGHGEVIEKVPSRIHALRSLRYQRNRQILEALAKRAMNLNELVESIYSTLDERLKKGAKAMTASHIIYLMEAGEIAQASLDEDTTFQRKS